jgi:hypothetical protein
MDIVSCFKKIVYDFLPSSSYRHLENKGQTMTTTKINDITSHYFITSTKVKQLINDLGRADDFEVVYDVDKFLATKPVLTIAERNCLKEIRTAFTGKTVKIKNG